jgi:hypothetical protein
VNIFRLSVTIFLLAVAMPAQTPQYQWHTFHNWGTGGYVDTSWQGVATDAEGNIYTVGSTDDPANFASGSPIHSVANRSAAAFVMKFDTSGTLLWYTFYTGFQGARAHNVALDSSGNVYVAGYGNLDTGSDARHEGGGQSFFVMKLDGNGQYQWHTEFGDGDEAYGIAVDSARSYVYVTGDQHCCSGSWGDGTVLHAHTYGTNDIFVLALGTDGSHQWHTFWGPGNGLGRAVALDSDGAIYAVGRQDGKAVVLKLNAPGSSAGWGSLAWINYYGTGGEAKGIVADTSGYLYLTGETYPDWNGPSGELPQHTCTVCASSVFLLKLTTGGTYVKHAFYSYNSRQFAQSIALDGRGMLYITGPEPNSNTSANQARTAFDEGTALHDNGGVVGHFVAAFDTGLNYKWHTVYGAPYGTSSTDAGKGITVDASRNLYVTGAAGAAWLGDDGTAPLSAYGGERDVWLQKFTIKSTPVITWAKPADIQFGSALGTAQLNAAASVAGTFAYSPAAGTVLPAGNAQTLSVTFTPADTASYTTATKTVSINVAAPAASSAAKLVITRTVARTSSQIVVTVAIANTGGTAAQNVTLAAAKIGSTSATPLPQVLGTVAAGSTVSATLYFPGTAGAAGSTAALSLAGTYTGGSFSSASRVVLP